MNTEIIVRPQLKHFGLATSQLDAMLDWYHKVLGMTVNYRSPPIPGPQRGPFASVAFVSNDEVHHRIALFEVPEPAGRPGGPRSAGLQHVAFQYDTLDDLLGTYVRLKKQGIVPRWAADEGLQISFYYNDPDGNNVELIINNYDNEWTATEHMRSAAASADQARRVLVDPDQLVAARQAGDSPWQVHQRALAGEFAPARPQGRPASL